jgi:type I restriction enzyme S subunit
MSVPVSTLGDETTIIMGQSPPGDSYNKERAGLPLLNGPTEFGPIHPTEIQWTTAPTKLCQPGDALFCVRGATAGRINVADKMYCLGRGLAAIRGKPSKLDASFLLHILRNGYAKFQARGVGSTFINISSEELSKFEVPALPLSEQQRIAEVLDRAEALRAKRRAALAHLDTLTESIFFNLFGDPTTNPKGMTVVKLSELTTRITDGVHQKPNYTESGLPFISVKDITSGVLSFEDCKFVSQDDHNKFTKRCKPEKNDILYTKVGATYGRPALVDTDREFSIYVSVCLIKPKKELVDPTFLFSALGTSAIKRQADNRIKGIGVPDLHLDQIQSFRIPLPSLSEQRDFSRRIAALEKLKIAHRASLAELDALFAVLQHRAFRGEI